MLSSYYLPQNFTAIDDPVVAVVVESADAMLDLVSSWVVVLCNTHDVLDYSVASGYCVSVLP